MAEFVEFRSEEMIPELEQMEKIRLFEKHEIRAIAKKRKEFEYKIQRRTKCKDDFLRYIQYEMDLLKLVNLRKEKNGSSFKAGDVIRAITNRVDKLYKNTIIKFQDDVRLWISYIKFCKSVGFTNSVSSILVRMLQVHSDKPNLWKVAANWEFEECHSIENARQFLLRGLRVHPESDVLYTEAFRLELLYADTKRKEKAAEAEEVGGGTECPPAGAAVPAKPKQEVVIPHESIMGEEKLLEGRLAEAMYQSAVKKIDDVEFVINLLNIAKDFDFTEKLQMKIIDDMLAHPRHRNNELMWDMMARRELEGLTYNTAAGMFMDGTIFVGSNSPDKKNNSLKERIRLCCLVYTSVVKQLPTERMWSLYLETLIELNQDLVHLPTFKQNLLRQAFQEAHSAGRLQEKYYLQWVDLLHATNKIKKLGLVLRQATERFPSNLDLWQMRLCYHLSNDEERMGKDVFQQAIAQLAKDSEATLPLWKNLIQYYQTKSAHKAQKVFEDGLKLGTPISYALKPLFLEWLLLMKGIQAAWKEYEFLSLQPPLSLELHMKMIKLECMQPDVNLKHVRKCYETACHQFGIENTDLWMSYVKFELREGDAKNISIIYDRAVKTLDPLQVDIFVNEFSLIKTGMPSPK